ncbi:uncharacterized protein LOC62_05G007174 [Vanrija pseudolonga]|uniref:Uncharacterized protein n=1 Tax=Vanrija pseudolonga TaxID=143232 RepID=A0AAF1BNX4_9TREE|nr:hypothetical protein LOC62_05G007174 [Vanrija pseudolonga]
MSTGVLPLIRSVKLVPTEPVTPLTMLFISFAVTGDWFPAELLLRIHPVIICGDLHEAGLVGHLSRRIVGSISATLLSLIGESGCIPTDPLIRAAALLLHNIAADLGPGKGVTRSFNDAVQARIEELFRAVPRVDEFSVPLYAVRCGLVYGAVAVQEYKAYQKNVKWWKRGRKVVSVMPKAVALVPDVAGVNTSTIVGPAVNAAAAAAATSGIDRKKKRLSEGVFHVEHKFTSQVLEEADQGLIASYVGSAPTDRHRNPIPAYPSETTNMFKLLAWRVFYLTIEQQGFETAVENSAPRLSDHKCTPRRPPSPKVSTDTQNPKVQYYVDTA